MKNILCLGKGTKVLMKNNSVKSIETVQVGDKIINYNQSSSAIEIVEVKKTAKSFHSIINRLALSNGTSIECTTDHPIWTKSKGWSSVDFKETFDSYNVGVQPLVVGDECLVLTDNKIYYSKIISIDTLVGDYEMFDISGGDNHCFFANNILVHDENLTELNITNSIWNSIGTSSLLNNGRYKIKTDNNLTRTSRKEGLIKRINGLYQIYFAHH